MSSRTTSLVDLGPIAVSHLDEVEDVKRQTGITSSLLDAWVYLFLENKKFNIAETVAKLHRRHAMEFNELATYTFTDHMREALRSGVLQEIGVDKLGRVVFLVTSKRETNDSKLKEEQRHVFDIAICMGTRLRESNKRSQMVMLINQEGANLLKGDLSSLATRVAKFYPGGVDKMLLCKMGRMMAAMAKPIFKRLPPIMSDRLVIVDDSDIKKGYLREIMDDDVLPVIFGGKNDCDNKAHWFAFAERAERYYAEMKAALVERGISVKEWEIEKLEEEGHLHSKATSGAFPKEHTSLYSPMLREVSMAVQTMRTPSAREENASAPSSQAALKTCLSEDPDVVYSYAPLSPANEGVAAAPGPSWLDVMSDLPRGLSVFFLGELLRWRLEIEDQEDNARYVLFSKYSGEHSLRLIEEERRQIVGGELWNYGIPASIRKLERLLFRFFAFLSLIFFVAALVFLACFGADVLATLYFGFFVQYNYFYPLSCVLLMVFIQFVSMCARACDFIECIVKNEVIPLLLPFGRVGFIIQRFLYLAMFLIQFIIFCIYAVTQSPLRGLQICFATGWISAVLVVAFTHAFFFTGFFSSRRKEANSFFALPIFLSSMFSGSREYDAVRDQLLWTSNLLITGLPTFISILLGIGFLISRIVSLYVCTLVSTMVSAFVMHLFTNHKERKMHGTLMRLSHFLWCVTWLFVTFAFGFSNFERKFASTVIVAVILVGSLLILSFIGVSAKRHPLILRLTFILFLVYIIGCWICCFPIVGYRMGLFCLAIMVHNALNIIFSPNQLTNVAGTFFLASALCMLVMSCVLLGWYGTTVQYVKPRSLPSVPVPAADALSTYELYHRYPVCTLTFGDDDAFTIEDLALLTELVSAQSSAVLQADFDVWFSGRDITYAGVTDHLSADGMTWAMHRFDATSSNLTFLAVSNPYASTSIVAMTAWIDSLALAPLNIFLPWYWADTLVFIMSFSIRLIKFRWLELIDSLSDAVKEQSSLSNNKVILLGSGVAGGISSVSAVKTQFSAVVFAAPGILHILRKLGQEFDDYHKYVLDVGAYYGVLDNVGGQDVSIKQKLLCHGKAKYCLSPEYISTTLLENCQDMEGRRHT